MPTMSGSVNNAGSRKQRDGGTGALPRNAVGPDKCSCLCVHTEFQESSPRLPAAMVLLLVSITVLHLVTLAMLLIATLEKVRRFLGLCEGPHPLHTHTHSHSPSPSTLVSDSYQAFLSSVCVLSLALQSWWVWSDSEITDLWYNCFHDNATDTWMCAASSENGKSLIGSAALFTRWFASFARLKLQTQCENLNLT